MREQLLRECEALLGDGRAIAGVDPLAGGDTSAIYRLRLNDGTQCVAKVQPLPDRLHRSTCEADGLRWLAGFEAVRVPEVLGVSPSGVLLLEAIVDAPPTAATQTAFGEALASLHTSRADRFGHARDNYVGAVPQRNTSASTWAEFFAEHRLRPLVETCIERGSLPPSTRGLVDRLAARLPELCAPEQPPAPLHGDLWSGNVLWTDAGAIVIDPAAYAGHREIDLAMMRLFGGFGPRVFDAYQACAPLPPDHEDRVELFQLYPVLVHAILFDSSGGGGYATTARRTLERYA